MECSVSHDDTICDCALDVHYPGAELVPELVPEIVEAFRVAAREALKN
jgi:hypothetical protein